MLYAALFVNVADHAVACADCGTQTVARLMSKSCQFPLVSVGARFDREDGREGVPDQELQDRDARAAARAVAVAVIV